MIGVLPVLPEAPFPFTVILGNGPRRQGFASPRKKTGPLDRSGPFRARAL